MPTLITLLATLALLAPITPAAGPDFATLPDEELVARAIAGETTGQPLAAKIGVAWVIRNRHEQRGQSYYDVLVASGEFTSFKVALRNPNGCWVARAVNDPLALLGEKEWAEDWWIAYGVLHDYVPNPIGDATLFDHQHENMPWWAKPEAQTAAIGAMRFFRETKPHEHVETS